MSDAGDGSCCCRLEPLPSRLKQAELPDSMGESALARAIFGFGNVPLDWMIKKTEKGALRP
jgi:hypothetical protein